MIFGIMNSELGFVRNIVNHIIDVHQQDAALKIGYCMALRYNYPFFLQAA